MSGAASASARLASFDETKVFGEGIGLNGPTRLERQSHPTANKATTSRRRRRTALGVLLTIQTAEFTHRLLLDAASAPGVNKDVADSFQEAAADMLLRIQGARLGASLGASLGSAGR